MESDDDSSRNLLAILGIPTFVGLLTAAILVISIPFQILYAWIFLKLWTWFLVPLHFPIINIWEAWGVYTVVRFFTSSTSTSTNKGWIKIIGSIIGNVLGALITLLIGYIIHGHIRVG